MTARIHDIADALVARIDAGSYSLSFTPVRIHAPVFEPDDIVGLQVSVLPLPWELERQNRANHRFVWPIDVGVQKQLDAANNATIDPLMGLLDELVDVIRADGGDFATLPGVHLRDIELLAAGMPEHLRRGIFTGVLRCSYQEVR